SPAACLRAGASAYARLPVDPLQLTCLLEALFAGTHSAPDAFAEAGPLRPRLDPELSEQIHRVAPLGSPLLFSGETGTGKPGLARLIHELSPRRAEPFLVIDCGALSPTLIESAMFGHVKGAFPGADCDRPGKFTTAGAGTLLLDEINALPAALQ